MYRLNIFYFYFLFSIIYKLYDKYWIWFFLRRIQPHKSEGNHNISKYISRIWILKTGRTFKQTYPLKFVNPTILF
jgi:hypothetical protein